MRVISVKTLRDFWAQAQYQDAEAPLRAWNDEAKHAEWKTPQDVKNLYRNASIVANNRAVFNIAGNKYRLVVAVKYELGIAYVRFVATHAQYDRIDATTI